MKTEQSGRAPLGRKLSVTICHPKKSFRRDVGTQTDYRDSEAQTVPWCPPVIFRRRRDGKRIAEEWLSFGVLTMDEAILMERARQREAWEEALSKKCGFGWLSCVVAIAANEFAFRESLLRAEHEERLQLSRDAMKRDGEMLRSELERRTEKIRLERLGSNSAIIEFWRRQKNRKLRKLAAQNGIKPITEDRSLGMKNNLSKNLTNLTEIAILKEHIAARRRTKIFSPPKSRNICSRMTKIAQNELDDLQGVPRQSIPTKTIDQFRRQSTPDRPSSRLRDQEEELNQASLLLGKVIKGRAAQTRLFAALIERSTRKPPLTRTDDSENLPQQF